MFGPYRLLRTLGEGEFGKVKLAVHTEDNKEVAIKLIKKESIESPNRRSKLMREISILQSLDHKYIVKLIEVIETDHYIGIVLEYASGGELFEYILAHRYLKERDACRFFAQLLAGVAYIHSVGIVHRDLKLENLLLDANKCIIITDFGFANKSRSNDSDLLQTSCGSPCYAAPELVISDGYVGEAADIWSCGVILYAMLCGYLPFDDDPDNPDGDNINLLYKYILETELDVPDYISEDARMLLQRMLVPDPKYRAKMPEVMAHRWLAPAAHIFEEEGKRYKALMNQSTSNGAPSTNAANTPPGSPMRAQPNPQMPTPTEKSAPMQIPAPKPTTPPQQSRTQQQPLTPIQARQQQQVPMSMATSPGPLAAPQPQQMQAPPSPMDIDYPVPQPVVMNYPPQPSSATVQMAPVVPAIQFPPPPASPPPQQKVPSPVVAASAPIPAGQPNNNDTLMPSVEASMETSKAVPQPMEITDQSMPDMKATGRSKSAAVIMQTSNTTPAVPQQQQQQQPPQQQPNAITPVDENEVLDISVMPSASGALGRHHTEKIPSSGASNINTPSTQNLKHSASFRNSNSGGAGMMTWFKRRSSQKLADSPGHKEGEAAPASGNAPTLTRKESQTIGPALDRPTNVDVWGIMPPPRYPQAQRSKRSMRNLNSQPSTSTLTKPSLSQLSKPPVAPAQAGSSNSAQAPVPVLVPAPTPAPINTVPTPTPVSYPAPPMADRPARRGTSVDAGALSSNTIRIPTTAPPQSPMSLSPPKANVPMGRPSMQAPSISNSDYQIPYSPSTSTSSHNATGSSTRPGYASPSIGRPSTSGGPMPMRMRYHTGPIDQRALTSRDPDELAQDLEKFFEDRGLVMLSNGYAKGTGEYRMKVMRPGFRTDLMRSSGGGNASGPISAGDLEGLPGIENLARQSLEEDYGSYVNFGKKSMDAAALRVRISMDASRSLYNGQTSINGGSSMIGSSGKSLKEKKRQARGAAKLALVIASLPVSLVKRIKYYAAHGPAWDRGFDGKTDLTHDPVMNAAAAALVISNAKQQQLQNYQAAEAAETGAEQQQSPQDLTVRSSEAAPRPSTSVRDLNGSSNSTGVSLKDVVEASLTTVVDEIRFYVEIQKIKNLPGLYVVDFKRIRGDIWAFKRLYHGLVGDMPLKD
ncbi:hypothetical protein HDV05_007195 [Chytridiales sp. JEL 0842]|nr:hypothetical protein HDV05_007195 [Chytridiales sp. JEL 0842]